MPTGRRILPTEEQQIVRAAGTQSISAVARRFGLDRKTIRKILKKNRAGGLDKSPGVRES